MRILDTGRSSADENMKIDTELLASLAPEDEPILHIYQWEGLCATHGHFIEPELYLDLEACASIGLSLARRPTGGGIIFHLTDWAYSVLVPTGHPRYSLNTLENYRLINEAVIEALSPFVAEKTLNLLPMEPTALDESSTHFCMAKPTKYDVMVAGRKIGGAAQRRSKSGFLHQGTISISPMSQTLLKKVLLPETRVAESMQANGWAISQEPLCEDRLEQKRTEVAAAVQRALCQTLEVVFCVFCCILLPLMTV